MGKTGTAIDGVHGRVHGKVALVTGSAARGIGRACVERLAREGATVYGSDRDVEGGRRQAEHLAAEGLDVHFVALDVTREDQWIAAVDEIIARSGRLDVLVNNAGIATSIPIAQMSLAQFRALNEINFKGSYLGLKHAIRVMRANPDRSGSIVNLSSVAGHVGLPNYVHYCASKGAVKNLTKAAALECGENGDAIRINSVHPGPIWTSLQQGLIGDTDPAPVKEMMRNMTPLKILAEADDVASAILFLASDESSYMTGASLTIDGGFTAG